MRTQEIMTAVTMEDGSMLVSSRKNYIVELNGTKTYVKECVPDDVSNLFNS